MFSLNYKVTTSTCDHQGKLKIFSALQMMQDCSELWFSSEPIWKNYYDNHGMAQVLAFRQVEVHRLPLFGEDVTVETSIFDCSPRFGLRNTIIYDAHHQPCLSSWSMGAFINRETGALTPAPKEACESITIEEKRPMNYLSRKIAIPKSEPKILDDFPVWQDYIDYNNHVNNAQYIRLAEHCLENDLQITGLSVEFKHPARMGDVLKPFVYTDENRYVVVLKINDEVSSIIEFRI